MKIIYLFLVSTFACMLQSMEKQPILVTQCDDGSILANNNPYSNIQEFVKAEPTTAALLLEQNMRSLDFYRTQKKELIHDIETCKAMQQQYEILVKKENAWNKFITPVYYGLHGLAYVSLGYCFVAIHNDVCTTPSHTSLHYYLCNPFG